MYEWVGRFARLETGGAGLNGAIRLPRVLILPFLKVAGWLLYVFMSRQRAVVRANMKDLLTEDNGAKGYAGRHVRAYFQHAAATMYELLAESKSLPERGDTVISVIGREHLADGLAEGKGAILFGPHMGNFFYYYWALSQHADCLTVATAESPELRFLYIRFRELGCKGLDYDATPPLELIRRLKAHLQAGGVVLLLGDFYRPQFPASRLFGRRTCSPAGAALLSLELGAPVIPFYGFRDSGLKHKLVLEEPLHLHHKFALRERGAAMLELNLHLERQIRSKPAQWLYWFNAQERWHHKT